MSVGTYLCPDPTVVKESKMPRIYRPRIAKICRHCDQEFLAAAYLVSKGAAIYCGYFCCAAYRRAHPAPGRAQWLAEAQARNRAFVKTINAQTVCAHCGRQPIEWHNPEHVELKRQGYRISSLAGGGVSLARIEAEMARCTPLCRRCHMAEDGRLSTLAAYKSPIQLPKPCRQCSQLYKPLARGLCKSCYRREPDQVEQTRHYAAGRLERARSLSLPRPVV